MSATTANKLAYSIHHVNFPVSDLDRTADWYEKVFGMEQIKNARPMDDRVVRPILMTNGRFDLHFSFSENVVNKPHHFAIEVDDWDTFIAHLEEIGIEYEEVRERPQNNSKTSVIHDPDGHRVELVWHGNRNW